MSPSSHVMMVFIFPPAKFSYIVNLFWRAPPNHRTLAGLNFFACRPPFFLRKNLVLALLERGNLQAPETSYAIIAYHFTIYHIPRFVALTLPYSHLLGALMEHIILLSLLDAHSSAQLHHNFHPIYPSVNDTLSIPKTALRFSSSFITRNTHELPSYPTSSFPTLHPTE